MAQLCQMEIPSFSANHQSEADPSSRQLHDGKADLANKPQITYVAGHKVTTDPLAIPFSMDATSSAFT
jgi:glycerol-3-phosphate O-acyltransferase